MGWGTFLGKLSTFIPSRVEQLKNEKARLLDERTSLSEKDCNDVASRRLTIINGRVREINEILGNKATD